MKSLWDIEQHFINLKELENKTLKEEFNKNIKSILREMLFDLDIYIDDNYNIVSRKKTKNGYRILESQNLASSERAVIALTLQLALANGYSSDIPIILCDGIFEFFDQERNKKILTFVDEFGKRHEKLIMMTVVKEGMSEPLVIPYEM
jgi:DNA repair exonuclease SbcCD ATPase subunit